MFYLWFVCAICLFFAATCKYVKHFSVCRRNCFWTHDVQTWLKALFMSVNLVEWPVVSHFGFGIVTWEIRSFLKKSCPIMPLPTFYYLLLKMPITGTKNNSTTSRHCMKNYTFDVKYGADFFSSRQTQLSTDTPPSFSMHWGYFI